MRRQDHHREEAFSDGVVCFAGTDWWYHPRGHSECQIMRRLAGRTRVLWINSIGMRAPKPGVTRRPLHRYWRKLRSTLRGLRKDPSGLWVFSPVFIPRYTPAALRLNGILIRAQVRLICRLIGIRNPSAWITIPTAAPAALGMRANRRVFNRCDRFSAFPQADSSLIESLERQLLTRCDTSVFVSQALYELERDLAQDAVMLGHGLDYQHFARDRDDPALTPTPRQLDDIETKIIGFYGGIEDYTVDLDLLLSVARRFRDATLVIAGPRSVGTTALESEPNVRVLGPIPYDILPAIASRFDVALMPWRQNEWIESCNPIKLKEYLALGFPVVSTPFPAMEPYRAHVRIGSTSEEFLEEVHAALGDACESARAARRAAVRHESWDVLAERVVEILGLAPALRSAHDLQVKPSQRRRRDQLPTSTQPGAPATPLSAASNSNSFRD